MSGACWIRRSLAVAALWPAVSCAAPDPPVRLEWQPVHIANRGAGAPPLSDSVRVRTSRGAVRIEGFIPLSGRCPSVEADAERERNSLRLHVVARETGVEERKRCNDQHEAHGVRYVAVLEGLRPGHYALRIRHAHETEREQPDVRPRAKDTLVRHQERPVANLDLEVP